MDHCPFCAIGAGEVDADLVASRTPHTYAIPALRQWPANPGHMLVLPTGHAASLWDMGDGLRTELFGHVARIAAVLAAAFDAAGTTVIQNNDTPGQTLHHLHVHVVPRSPRDGFVMAAATVREVPRGERAGQAAALRAALQA
ncbi:MAG TPA: HIT family protein [Mycobacterium sp.]|jgi:histidine triad (HIT) family protein|nr:HIT family protein [Mycobacterium sp.]